MLLYYWIYSTCCGKVIKCSTSLAFYLFFPTCLINSINHEHSCKILYLSQRHTVNIHTQLTGEPGGLNCGLHLQCHSLSVCASSDALSIMQSCTGFTELSLFLYAISNNLIIMGWLKDIQKCFLVKIWFKNIIFYL